ncbi:putative Transcriptional regulator AraC family [Vibrio nigripulchritudo SOn1]|uniref:Transcriptional regulator AraC family n=1 Tax=Vibrio nigripulchritudo SOn1 TaxID=1238450 RepID=A0AAV2VPY2_9VIBR|nr:AraC family transcriptional regulator [Vibrio nigripulchritudo]CCO46749.1 putative Transcriptional regulator AraC family [Vibrio nigripulchritudo SOn1]
MDSVKYHLSEQSGIQLIDADYQKFAFSRHYHLDFHIGLIQRGVQKFHHSGSSHKVGQGQIIVMPPDELHDGHSELKSGYQVKVFSIRPEWFADQLDLSNKQTTAHFTQLIIDDPTLFHQLSYLHSQLMHTQISQLAQDCLPFESFEQMLDQYGTIKPNIAQPLGKTTIQVLREYLMENLDQPIRLNALADMCQLTPSQFQRHFKARMGITPYAWLTRLRMEHALSLLLHGVNSVNVALRVGFYDQAHFVKAFKTTYGATPGQINCH